MNESLYRHIFSEVDRCPYCKSYNLIHQICKEIIICIDCQKEFTKQQAQEITGEVRFSTRIFNGTRHLR